MAKDNQTQNVLWSKTGSEPWTVGTNYQSGGFYYSKFYGDYLPSHAYSVKVKVTNDCGTSVASDWRNFTTPAPPEGCWWRTENEPLDTLNEHDLNLLTTCTPSIVYNNSKLNIILENNSCQDVNYSLFIFNILGQRVDVIRISENYDMEISSKPSGVYIAILVAESGKILSTAKFYK